MANKDAFIQQVPEPDYPDESFPRTPKAPISTGSTEVTMTPGNTPVANESHAVINGSSAAPGVEHGKLRSSHAVPIRPDRPAPAAPNPNVQYLPHTGAVLNINSDVVIHHHSAPGRTKPDPDEDEGTPRGLD